MENQTLARFYHKTIPERIDLLEHKAVITSQHAESLRRGHNVLNPEQADRMVENAIGVFGLPLGLGLHFRINGQEWVVPMAVEEPSIIAAVSAAAKLARPSGGFETSSDDPVAIGQIVIEGLTDPAAARETVMAARKKICRLANSLHTRLVARGGGARDVETSIPRGDGAPDDTLLVHLLVDTRDAMGANLVNSMCEAVAPELEGITGGRVLLRIISNLNDRSLARARVAIDIEALARNGLTGAEVRDRIVAADRFAAIDPHRAATHNKGILNGIDAVAIATGNDWRAIEAGAHAYAARDGNYRALTRWRVGHTGQLVGSIELPLNVGIVGGSLESNPAVRLGLDILDLRSARELSEIMAAVGLAQNLAALRALVTEGIQKGHMRLHARSVAQTAGAEPGMTAEVVDRLVASNTIKVWKAREIIEALKNARQTKPSAAGTGGKTAPARSTASAHGKVILLGEHAVLYGSQTLAAPIPLAVHASVQRGRSGVRLRVPRWGIDSAWETGHLHRDSVLRAVDTILCKMGISKPAIEIDIFPQVPQAMGLGSSAAAAVAVTRALAAYYALKLDTDGINRIAFEAERVIHGQSSGIDNTVISYATPLVFRAGLPMSMAPLRVGRNLPLVVGLSREGSLTAPMVERVRKGWQRNRKAYESLFRRIDRQVAEARAAIRQGDLEILGQTMNANHQLLRALDVSTPELEAMIGVARKHDALGAKLTGGGGGGAMIALCDHDTSAIAGALNAQGWQTLAFTVNPNDAADRFEDEALEELSPSEKLITVDDDDQETGQCTRAECHAGDGIRHRAFSIFIFDRAGRVLLQQRSTQKQLWPLFWSNSCCSHPRVGDTTAAAAQRRLTEELGIDAPLTHIYKFAYQARYDQTGSENELCSVFIGQTDQEIQPDPDEINAWRYIAPADLDAEIAATPERFTPWLKMEWKRLRHHPLVQAMQPDAAPVR